MNIFAHSSHFTPQSGGEFDPQRLRDKHRKTLTLLKLTNWLTKSRSPGVMPRHIGQHFNGH
ncbi:hypothetical protein [Scytonema millei]|uniref:hypothetical protein n=1 Tax=Scytonema millei TaxID=1245922 RepID=UPI001911C581|nr:hypothetical protein [Scytonema millei]